MWEWLNYHHIVDALQHVSDEVRDDVLDGLEQLALSPFAPAGVEVHQMRLGSRERWLAWLPHEYVLTYRPYIAGPPPYAGKHIVVLAIDTIDGLLPEL